MLKFIILTICAYFIFRWLDRMFRPAKNRTAQQQSTKSAQKTNVSDTITGKNTKSVIKEDVGEYVDFEEIKEKK